MKELSANLRFIIIMMLISLMSFAAPFYFKKRNNTDATSSDTKEDTPSSYKSNGQSREYSTPSINSRRQQSKRKITILAENGVMLREMNTENSNEIVLMPKGAEVEVIEKTKQQDTFEGNKNYWYRVRYKNMEGFCFGGFTSVGGNIVKRDNSNIIVILAENGVMLRKMPATSGDEIVLMPSGAKVEVIEKTNQQDTFEGNTNYWYRVRYGNAEGYCFGGFTDADKKAVTNNSSTSSTQTMLQNYYQAVENGTMRAENYFSPSVIQFITVKNTTPQGVNQVFASNTEFVNQQSTITSDLMPVRQENGINYYIFETSFKCFRRSLNKYQLCNTKVEVGIDQNTKICSYKETGVDNLRYVDANGNSQNTPDNANNENSNNDKYNGEVPSGYAQAVTESGCTIRSQPTVRSEQTDFVPRWEMMQVLSKTSVYQKIEDKSGYWYKISYNGKVGYCFGGFMKVNF